MTDDDLKSNMILWTADAMDAMDKNSHKTWLHLLNIQKSFLYQYLYLLDNVSSKMTINRKIKLSLITVISAKRCGPFGWCFKHYCFAIRLWVCPRLIPFSTQNLPQFFSMLHLLDVFLPWTECATFNGQFIP